MEKADFLKEIQVEGHSCRLYDIHQLEKTGTADIGRLPFSIRVLVENLLRHLDGRIVTEKNVTDIANWQKRYDEPVEIPFHPARVLMQDFTGVPAVVDLAAMRDAVKDLGGDPKKINPAVPVELVVDHSVQVDYFGTADCQQQNVAKEYERNSERYALLKWAQSSFKNVSVVPPNSGICHQVNLERLGRVVISENGQNGLVAYPDSLVGLDSHTTMINGIGVLGWGVGGIEAEAVMLGQPYYMVIPEVIGVKLVGELSPDATATDLVLAVTQFLRKYKVVEKFVEYFGPGMEQLSIPHRATIANMSPEYGATMGFFPVDEITLAYLDTTGRGDRVPLVRAYAQEMGLYYTGKETPEYTDVLEFDLSTVRPAVAGPSKPYDRIELPDLKEAFAKIAPRQQTGSACAGANEGAFPINLPGGMSYIGNGSVVIAAITSCTNTSNPSLLLGAGLMARAAVDKGLKVPPHVKTSLAPGSKVVTRYLEKAGLMPYFRALGFHPAAYGCATCIGNSGPLHPTILKLIKEKNLTVASVLSGNRNFEARIHQSIKSNFIMSPLLVLAFALAGRVDIDLTTSPLAHDPNGDPVFLKDIWPDPALVESLVQETVTRDLYQTVYDNISEGDDFWRGLTGKESTTFAWDPESSYIKQPPYFLGLKKEADEPGDIENARALLILGDSVTTDHISPAGSIPPDYPAGRYLIREGVAPEDFNSYGSRRGNHEVMMRGTFANIRLNNALAGGREGGFTTKVPEGEEQYIYDASMAYQEEGIPLVVLAGHEYGAGSSRDWAAKGTCLLGVRAVIARSYERIHRSNLVGMGVLPLEFMEGEDAASLGLNGSEQFTIRGLDRVEPRGTLEVQVVKADGSHMRFNTIVRLNTPVEKDFYRNGGILPFVLRKMTENE